MKCVLSAGRIPQLLLFRLSAIQQNAEDIGQDYLCLLGCVCMTIGFLLSVVTVIVLVMNGLSNSPEMTQDDEGSGGSSSSSSYPSYPYPTRATVQVFVESSLPVLLNVVMSVEPPIPTVPTMLTVPATTPNETTIPARPPPPTTPETVLPGEYYEETDTTGDDYDYTPPPANYSDSTTPVHIPLLCTVSVMIKGSSALPDDGLCDVIFYDSFYVKNDPLSWQDAHLDHFLDSGKQMLTTGIGVSLSPVNGKLFIDAFAPAFLSIIDKFLKRGVYSFGMLNVHGKYTAAADLAKCLDILQVRFADGLRIENLAKMEIQKNL
ncbi:uncharacterized protein LOC125945527 [Dermacentor silvarum]|uniref:uncharacterized protein LOC125945527 n=1 Tax=Dermacentor silvarum TaxID=543639 RepID=UPI002100A8DD|nr:uncharacterized protein LOC125945527 [Dermacentor silvarum]